VAHLINISALRNRGDIGAVRSELPSPQKARRFPGSPERYARKRAGLLTAPLDLEDLKLYSINQILWTTLLGGPFAGVFMIADNFNTLSEPSKKRQVLIIGFSLCLVAVIVGIYRNNGSNG
jgi:hypothetical protein